MERAMIIRVMIPTVVLALMLNADCQRMPLSPRPLCVSQFALVNHACSMLPFNPNPTPTPTPPSPDEPHHIHAQSQGQGQGQGRGHRHGHGHGHGSRHRHGSRHWHQESPAEEDCCRWLKEVDDECVCEVLVHLPVFLTRPEHDYTVVVDPTCSVSFSCGGRLKA